MGKTFRRKLLFFANGHNTKTPAAMTYLSVVSRDLVCITLAISDINDLDVLVCDIHNAYLMADCRERVWVVAGPEFGSKSGKNILEYFNLRDDKIEPLDLYPGATLAKMNVESVKVT